jgi:hypothetical protein
MTDAEFLAAFENCTLPRSEWTHAAHLRMAYLYLRRSDDTYDGALTRVRDGIRAYNVAQGNPSGYHETITVAFVRLLHDRIRRAPESAATFDGFRAAHPDLFDTGILLRHYSRPLLLSGEARVRFIEPDGTPLPAQ